MARVYLTGDLAVEATGRVLGPADIGGRQARLVFARLCWDRSLVSRAEFADLLWGGEPPASWESALAAVVSNLRSALPMLRIEHAMGGYQVVGHLWVDVEAARQALHEAEGALRSGRYRDIYSWSGIATTVTRRPFLPGEDGPWIERCRRALAALRMRALETAIEFCIWNREMGAAIAYSETLIEMEPFREASHRLLIRSHVANGDRAQALKAYERCRGLLVSELGVSPSDETEALYEQLLG